jgi:release factor glutamine methyltransferase
MTTWRALLVEATHELGDAGEARRIVEAASGYDGADLVLHLEDPATVLTHGRYRAMVERRMTGEPLQYVLGRWGFRRLDLFVDRRVLIPRPETEVVVEHALGIARELDAHVAVDLGTGSGAIAIALATELPGLDVWATDVSSAALDVARANLAGAGRDAARVRVVEGDWFDALPVDLLARVDVIVANPPYVATADPLPDEVRDWEPVGALIAGPTGVEAITDIVADAPRWLARPGALVVEIGETQGDAVTAMARDAGFDHAAVAPDLVGRPRVLVAQIL